MQLKEIEQQILDLNKQASAFRPIYVLVGEDGKIGHAICFPDLQTALAKQQEYKALKYKAACFVFSHEVQP